MIDRSFWSMKKSNLFSFYFSCTFTFFHCYFFSNFYLHRGARQSCLLLTPLLLDEGLPEWWPSWSQFSINFLLFGKIFIVLPTFSYSTEIVFNLNFTLSNQMSIFLWWQCPIAPQKKLFALFAKWLSNHLPWISCSCPHIGGKRTLISGAPWTCKPV